MEPTSYKTALIIGAGSGISAAAARAFTASGMKVALAARDARKLDRLAAETGSAVFAVDAADPAGMRSLFDQVDGSIGSPEVVLYNPGARAHGPLADIDPEDVASRSRYARSAGSSRYSRLRGAWCPRGMAPSC